MFKSHKILFRKVFSSYWTQVSTQKKKKKKSVSHVRLFATPWSVTHQDPLSMEFSGKNTGVGCHFLLQGIFLTQGLNPGLLYWRQILYLLSHKGSPQHR